MQVVLAWAFVALRASHSGVHIVVRDIRLRIFVYLASVAILLAMWIGFFIDMVSAADAYHAAMAGVAPQP